MAKRKQHKEPTCDLCGDESGHLGSFKVLVTGKTRHSWKACRACRAVMTVLLSDPRNRRRPKR